jgi:hypothetical protein
MRDTAEKGIALMHDREKIDLHLTPCCTRAQWQKPLVRRLDAGAAELAVGATGDGVDFS